LAFIKKKPEKKRKEKKRKVMLEMDWQN